MTLGKKLNSICFTLLLFKGSVISSEQNLRLMHGLIRFFRLFLKINTRLSQMIKLPILIEGICVADFLLLQILI